MDTRTEIESRPEIESERPSSLEYPNADDYRITELVLSGEDAERFLETVFNPPPPNEAFKKAVLNYKKFLRGELP
ncbi:hypothetical protein V0288_14720 [Pannus brasiliensis CCIBt3594]|uniref:DUF1778 domain-containing protein n=1 Tax=Pannus brasiliensis CCIBt3594 TaxID=1427578 RepID=A0AAW9QXY8_9CHRO